MNLARRWLCATGLVAAAVGAYYLWQLRAPGYRLDWVHDQDGYYNYLGRAFAHGRLELPIRPDPQLLALANPWDPAVGERYKMHDMALFRGRYYLYHGPGPAVMLFTPWLLLTGHDLPERFALFLLCFGGFLFSCGALMQLLALAGTKTGPLLLAPMVLALGICQSAPYLLNRVWVYEIAIAGGYFCISGAVFFLTMGIQQGRRRLWLGASGLLFGCAVCCRPHLGLAGAIALAALAFFFRRRRRDLMAFASAFSIVVLALASYNFLRFGNPLEFGLRYLLAGPDQNRIRLSAANVLPGLYYWLGCRPDFSAVFPWVRVVYRYPFGSMNYQLPKGYFLEATAGVVYLAPFVVAAVFIPRVRAVRVVLGTIVASAGAVLLFLAATGFTTQRYEVDFLPAAILAALVNFAVFIDRSAGMRGVVLRVALVLAIAWGVVANLALGIRGPYDDMVKRRPNNYVRLARWFSPIQEFRPVLNPAVHVGLTAEIAQQQDGFREPLVVMGGQPWRYSLFVEHTGGTVRMVSVAGSSIVEESLENRRVAIRIWYVPGTGKVTTAVDGREVASQDVGTLVIAPSEIAIGTNFTGTIRNVEKSVGER